MSDEGFLLRVVRWFADPVQWSGPAGIPTRLVEHVVLVAVSVVIAAAIALPVAMYIGHRRRFERLVVSIAGVGRALPSLGIIVMAAILLGLQLDWPAALRPSVVVAMVLLGIPPMLTNAYVGIQGVDEDTVEAARGMGMGGWQVLRSIELPLAAPLIVTGLRIAAVQIVATATLAAIVAGGGLGRFIVDGTAQRDFEEIFGGALLVALLAILVELAFGILQRVVTPTSVSRAEVRKREVQVRTPPELGPAA
jgi:osmoprotectant transport system permease protein